MHYRIAIFLVTDSSKVMLEAMAALQTVGLVNKFMIPFAMAGRIPTDLEIETEIVRLRGDEVDGAQLLIFEVLCDELRFAARLLTHAPGRA